MSAPASRFSRNPIRVPLFLEIDLTCGELEEADEPGEVKLPIWANGGRIVTEDGTILGEIAFPLPEGG